MLNTWLYEIWRPWNSVHKWFLTSTSYFITAITFLRWSPSGDICLRVFHMTGQQHYWTSKLEKRFILETSQMGVNFHCLINKSHPGFFLDSAMSVCFIWENITVKIRQRRKRLQETIWEKNHELQWIIAFENYV